MNPLIANAHGIAGALVALQYEQMPELESRYGPAGRQKCLEDGLYHIEHLAEAVDAADDYLFWDYVAWADILLTRRHIPTEHLASNLRNLQTVLSNTVDAETAGRANDIIGRSLKKLLEPRDPLGTFILPENPLADTARQYLALLLEQRESEALGLIEKLVASGTPLRKIYLDVFAVCQYEIGRLWQINAINVAQEHQFTGATMRIMSSLIAKTVKPASKEHQIVLASVSGEHHDLGIRMVSDFYALDGWAAHYVGADTPDRDIIAFLKERSPQIFAVSATLVKHRSRVRSLIAQVRQAGIDAMIIVGGRAFSGSDDAWRSVGADAYAANADSALVLGTHFRTI